MNKVKHLKVIHILSSIFAFAVILSCTACQKDGKFDPKYKLTEIYLEQNYSDSEGESWGTQFTLAEVWRWGEVTLQGVDKLTEQYYYELEYDHKLRLEKIQEFYGNYCQFTYDGKQLHKMEVFTENDELIYKEEYEYTKSKITKINVSDYEDDKTSKKERSKFSIFNYMLADNNVISEKKDNKDESYNLILEWEEDNISKITINRADNRVEVVEYEYDTKQSPFHNAFHEIFFEQHALISKNNIVKKTHSLDGKVFRTESSLYDYQYEFPVKKTTTTNYTMGTFSYIYIETSTFMYSEELY